MDKINLAKQLNQHFFELQTKATQSYLSRLDLAMSNDKFRNNELLLRKAQLDLAKSKAMDNNANVADLEQQIQALTNARNTIAKELNIDLNYHYSCPKCNDSGWVDGKSCSCRQYHYIALLKQNSGITPLINFTFKDNKIHSMNVPQAQLMQLLYSKMQEFCNKFDTTSIRQILLMGDVGVGKTALASAVVNQLVEQGKLAMYITAYDINRVFLSTHINNDSEQASLYSAIKDCDFLVIDDLGTEPVYRNVTIEYLFSLIDFRIMNNKKTMVCTNLSDENFVNRYGERALSRLTDKRYSIALKNIKGDDLRKIK